MIRVALVRGKYLNLYEGQNFVFSKRSRIYLTGISSLRPLHNKFPFSVKKMFSPMDLIDTQITRYIANRTVGDLHGLLGLGNITNGFDIFHTADSHYYFSYQLAKLRKQKKIKLLLATSWETIPFNNESTSAKKTLKRFTMTQIDHFICPTDRARKTLIQEGINKNKITVLPLGINLSRFNKVEKRKEIATILFVGRLVEEKGVLDLYKAFKRIQNSEFRIQNRSLRLKIVGEGQLEATLKRMIVTDGFGSYVSIERRDYEEMHSVFNESDIIVIPSKTTKTWEEQYGMVAVEAMASGIPIIAYSSGALPEVLSQTAIFVKEGDINSLVRSISRVIKDDQLRLRLGTIARRRAESNFDSKKVSKKYISLYETLSRNTLEK